MKLYFHKLLPSADKNFPVGVAQSSAWVIAIRDSMIVLAIVGALHWRAIIKAIQVWQSTPTYSYAFLILPIVALMIWHRRAIFLRVKIQVSSIGIGFLGLASCLAEIARLAEIAELEQFCIIAMAQSIILVSFGMPVFRAFLLPFLYLYLLVPSFQFLLPWLQELTITVSAFVLEGLKLPVLQEGIVLYMPGASYEVAPGCAGLNFVLVSLAFGLLFSELSYASWMKRLCFVVASIFIAIIANWLRVIFIILGDYFTNQTTSIVDDHLLYGWAFFSVTLLFLMWIGQALRDDEFTIQSRILSAVRNLPRTYQSHRGLFFMISVAFVSLFAGSAAAWQNYKSDQVSVKIDLPKMLAGLHLVYQSKCYFSENYLCQTISRYEDNVTRLEVAIVQPLSKWGGPYLTEIAAKMTSPAESKISSMQVMADQYGLLQIDEVSKNAILQWYQIGNQAYAGGLNMRKALLREKILGPGSIYIVQLKINSDAANLLQPAATSIIPLLTAKGE